MAEFVVAALAMGMTGAAAATDRFEYTEMTMGVEARIVLYAPDEDTARTAARAAFDRMHRLDAVLSDWRDDSDLMQLNIMAGTGPRPVSEDLYRALETALEYARLTNGAFDPTVGPVIELWRQARRTGERPDPYLLQDRKALVGWRKVKLEPGVDTLTVTLREPNMRLDMGAIGKGYAADQAMAVLRSNGIASAIVDVGGDLAIGDAPPGREGWSIAVGPLPDRTITVSNAGVATSSDAEQYMEFDGKRYSHVVDPRTGVGVTHRLSVTVIGSSATAADALASAVSVLGSKDGRHLVDELEDASVIMHGPDDLPVPGDRLAWWRKARFGMFIHWGLYAIPGGQWEERIVPGVAEWIMHDAQIPRAEYETLRDAFDPVNFDAREWARLARTAGMRYIVVTTKHHDGFALFHSEHTDWDVERTPFGRDIMRELVEACRREGLRIGWYHSILDWHHPHYLPRPAWDPRPGGEVDFDRYVEHLHAQVTELLTNYGPIDIMWFDGEWDDSWTHKHGEALYTLSRELQPDIIVNNRVDKGRDGMQGLTRAGGFLGDFGTPEQRVPVMGLAGVDWETCMTMNDSWGFKASDHAWKSVETLIRMLVDAASKGGNFLLNVGPTALGEIPQPSVERLEAMGAWLQVNGQSIYGTSAGPFPRLAWGRCTQRALPGGGTRLYLHVFEWPDDRQLVVPGLRNEPTRAWMLNSGRALRWQRNGQDVMLRVQPTPVDSINTVIVVQLDGPADVAPYAVRPDSDGVLRLDAIDAVVLGEHARHEPDGGQGYIGAWSRPGEGVAWTIELAEPSAFQVTLEYACAPGHGGVIELHAESWGPAGLRARIDETGSWTAWRTTELGRVEFAEPGAHELRVTPVEIIDGALMNLRSVTLRPIK